MGRLTIAEGFRALVQCIDKSSDLSDVLSECSRAMGFRYFALAHHIDFASSPATGIRLHNYPADWQHWFDARRLGRVDPIHRASHVASFGFNWSLVPRMIELTQGDREVLREARRFGIGDGFTVPSAVAGEHPGSCSFAVGSNQEFPEDQVLIAQLVGGLAFEAARRIARPGHSAIPVVPLTDRQRDCVLWAARGKTDWEIARILGISKDTVIQHLKHARERYGVERRAHLAVMALYEGSICFSDIFIY